MSKQCLSCGQQIIRPSGSSSAKVLVLGEFPNKFDMENGRPFASHWKFTTAGAVLRKEFERAGISLNQFRTTMLWLHEPNKSEECYNIHYAQALDEAKGRSAILLVGSEVVEAFTTFKVSDVSGLQVDSPILSAPIIYAMPNPSQAFVKGIGEIRLSIEKFAKRLEAEGLA